VFAGPVASRPCVGQALGVIEPSRRAFLTASVAGLSVIALGLPDSARATVPGRRPLCSGPFPRTFVFRQSEVLAQFRSYQDWAAAFVPFGGIMGKVLPEERTDTVTARNLTYFNRFKRQHPDKIVLIHYNGRGRLPDYRTSTWQAGDWLHYAGATVTAAVHPGDTVFTVDDATGFTAPTDPYGTVGADLVLTGRTADGRPDWANAEQLIVTAVDSANRTLTVQRAGHGTAALALPPGAYVARHVTLGPWSAQDGRLWAYNLATNAPRGADGRNAVERICAEMAADFAAGGQLARLDGIQFDIFTFPVPAAQRGQIDGDGDGVGDGCIAAGVDTFLAGQADFLTRLRPALGGQRIIATDGAEGQQPDAAVVNGIEEEGFATGGDAPLDTWSTYLGALDYWEFAGHPPTLSYPLVKTGTGVGDPPDFPGVRISIAAALLSGCQLSFWDEPDGTSLNGLRKPPDSGQFVNRFSVWDELLDGAAGDPGWLGMPLGGPIWQATTTPDLLDGTGVRLPSTWIDHLALAGASATRIPGPAVRLVPLGTDAFSMTFTLADFAGGDLVVVLSLSTDVSDGIPSGVPRVASVRVRSGTTGATSKHYVGTRYHRVRAYARDLSPGNVHVQVWLPAGPPAQVRALRVHASADVGYRLFDNGAVFANPSLHPHTFDVSSLGSFVRLTATAGQDSTVNDGTAVGSSLTVGATDAIVVRRAAQP
jgi:hypothetical protein